MANIKEYAYIDNGIWVRNKWDDVRNYANYQTEKDFFTTWVTYTSSDLHYGKVYGNLVLDFDADGDIELARKETLEVVDEFTNNYGIKPDDMYIIFSGSKGFHLEIPYKKIMTPDKEGKVEELYLAEIYKYWATKIKEYKKTIDLKIYTNKAMWRVPNSLHSKSGLYCIYINYDDLKGDVSLILKKAEKKSTKPKVDETLNKKINEVYVVAKEKIETDIKSFKRIISKIGSTLNQELPCINAILKNGYSEARNNALYVLSCYFKHKGLSQAEAETILLKEWIHRGEEEMKDKDIERCINSAYRSIRDGIGCNNEVMATMCDKINCPLHNFKDDKPIILTDEELDRYIEDKEKEGYYDPVFKLGMNELDEKMPIRKSDLMFIVAPPSSGKTTLLFNFMINIAKQNKKIMYYSLEEDEQDWKERKAKRGLRSISNLTHINPEQSVLYLHDLEENLKSGLYDVVCIDQLNKIKIKGLKGDYRIKLMETVQELRALSKKYKIPLFIIHQLNRGWEEKQHPTFSLLAESSALEQESSRLICLWSYDYNQFKQGKLQRSEEQKRAVWEFGIYILKGRGRELGKVDVIYNMAKDLIMEKATPWDNERSKNEKARFV